MKKALALFLSLLLFCSAALADKKSGGDTWICLNCGQEVSGETCPVCGTLQGAWICVECGTRNLSAVCMNCDRTRDVSVAKQAADARPVAAFPSVRWLAASGDAASLFRLGQYYEKGIVVGQDKEKALSCFRNAAEAGHIPAWIYLGRLYDSGTLVGQDYALAMDCYQRAANLGSAEAYWYIGSFYEEGTGVEQNYALAIITRKPRTWATLTA